MNKTPVVISAAEAARMVRSGDTLYVSAFACTPEAILEALCDYGRTGGLRDVRIIQMITLGDAPYFRDEFEGVFEVNTLFVGDNLRREVGSGRVEYIPVGLHETQKLIRGGYVKCDIALISVSAPDEHGYVSLGVSVDMTLAAVQNATRVVAVVNPNVPRTMGDALIPYASLDAVVYDDRPVREVIFPAAPNIDRVIGAHCAELIHDGDCLQLGIGSIPNAILALLEHHRELGIHSEMISDGVVPLVEKGVVTGGCKAIDRGKIVACFMMGSHRLYRFAHDNPMLLMKDVAYTNDPFIIARNPNVVAINSAIEIDLTGQVCADSIGTRVYSGVGGQLDFIYGASRSENGRAVIAIASTTGRGISKIVPVLMPGAGVVTPRQLVYHVVTEYGAVNLYGKSLQERARLLISIAHPSHRESLERAAFERFGPRFHM